MASTCNRLLITQDIKAEVMERCSTLPVFKNSHRKEKANIVGVLGEVMFERLLNYYGIPFSDQRDSTKMDYLVNGWYSVDVKTKDRTVPPRLSFDNSVPQYNHSHQRPSHYFFVSLHRDKQLDSENYVDSFRYAFLVGGIDIETLDREGVSWVAGQVDPSNGTKFWTDCINVSMYQLVSNINLMRRLSQ